MNETPDKDLFDYAAARAARDAGIEQGDDNADPDWKNVMYEILLEVARRKPEFSSDDCFMAAAERVMPETHDRRAMGAVMQRAAREGVCKKINKTVMSARKSLHASPIQVWRSLLCASVRPEHAAIWLQPKCCAGPEGQLWCEDDVGPCECGKQWTRYVLAP